MRDSDAGDGALLSVLQKARLKAKVGDTKGAIHTYRTVIESWPSCRDAYTELVRILIDGDRYDMAHEVLESLLERAPDCAEGHFLAGVVAYVLGDYAGALAHYQKARDAEGLDAALAVNIALCHEGLGDLTKAAEYFERAAAERVSNWHIYEALADAYHALGRRDDELRVVREATERFPGVGRLWALAGRAYLSAGNATVAIMQLRRSLDLEPGEPETMRLLAHALIENESAVEAEGVLRDLVAHEPWRASNWLLFCETKLALGKVSHAAQVARLALERFTEGDRDLQEFLSRLEREHGVGGEKPPSSGRVSNGSAAAEERGRPERGGKDGVDA